MGSVAETYLEKRKKELVQCCIRLREYSVKLEELREKGESFEEIEELILKRKALAEHAIQVGKKQVQPHATTVARERIEKLPAEIAETQEELSRLRIEAREYVKQHAAEIVDALLACGGKVIQAAKAKAITFEGISTILEEGQARFSSSPVAKLEKKLLLDKGDLLLGERPYDYYIDVCNECYREANQENGFNFVEDLRKIANGNKMF